ncbi:hypothetical protein [Comamonas sp. MYb396]|uniref:hypothetical protein n=1 Tax=Comamonas sp. MYb396 TaxID=2745302 RepID=UPI0030DA2B27
MSERSSNLQDLAERLAALREEGAELLARRPAPGTSDHARLSWIDAQIEALSRQLQQGAGQP